MLSAWCTGCNIPVVESCTRQKNKKKEETKQATSLEKYLLPCWYVSKKGCSVNVAMQSVERVLIKEKTTLAADCERQRASTAAGAEELTSASFFFFLICPQDSRTQTRLKNTIPAIGRASSLFSLLL